MDSLCSHHATKQKHRRDQMAIQVKQKYGWILAVDSYSTLSHQHLYKEDEALWWNVVEMMWMKESMHIEGVIWLVKIQGDLAEIMKCRISLLDRGSKIRIDILDHKGLRRS